MHQTQRPINVNRKARKSIMSAPAKRDRSVVLENLEGRTLFSASIHISQTLPSHEPTSTPSISASVPTFGLSDLEPYRPAGWSAPVVATTISGAKVDTPIFTTTNTVFVDFAIDNDGLAAVTTAFTSKLELDGKVVGTWNSNPPLNVDANGGIYTYVTGFSVGRLAPGAHTLTLVIDSSDAVGELDKSNNTYTKIISVGYTTAQIRHFYGLDQVNFTGTAADGAGQTIAMVELGHDPTLGADLAMFDAAEHLSAPPSLTVVGENGSSNLPPTIAGFSTGEESLDVEWAHAIAPAARILVVEAPLASSNSEDMTNVVVNSVNTAKSWPGVSVVSISYGVPEGQFQAPDSTYTTPAGHPGVTFVAASGDGGAFEKPDSNGDQSSQVIVNSPAISPNVLAVGGTTLVDDSSGNPASEIGWGYRVSNGSFWGSGGGVSTLEPEPAYQKSVAGNLRGRGVPDVAFEADWGVQQYDTSSGGWFSDGGTSLAAPCWAAIIAIVNQGRLLKSLPTLNGPSDPTLPAIYNLPASDFNDITSGTNGVYSCKSGYDLVTGRGTPIATKLIPDLVGGAALPDLKPYTPSGWSAPIVTSTVTGTHTNASTITTANTIYVDWAEANLGQAPVNTKFFSELEVDGRVVASWNTNPPMGANTWTGISDYALAPLSAGQHTITLVVDSSNSVAESNETNNIYNKTISVVPTGSISGTVFNDTNGNGKQDTGEIDLSGWTVDIDQMVNGNNVVVATAVTDKNGNFSVKYLNSGNYEIVVVQNPKTDNPTGNTVTGYQVSLGAGKTLSGYSFGEKPIA